jgi:hypothetical protein
MGAVISLQATSSKSFAAPLEAAVVDHGGAIDPSTISVTSSADGRIYWAVLFSRADLPPGLHRGTLEVRLCQDAATRCARPVSGSPWRIPYQVLVIDDAAYSIADWQVVDETVPFDGRWLSAIGSTLFALDAGMGTWRSADAGASWQVVPDGLAPYRRGFTVASDGAALYLAGGEPLDSTGRPLGTLPGDVYRFDGAAWTRMTDAAPFAGRYLPALVSHHGTLHLFGGGTSTANLHDAWKSEDGGATWSRLPDLPDGSGLITCATTWNGAIALVGRAGHLGCLPGADPACPSRTALWTSTDATTWQSRPGYADPFLVGATSCASLGQRLYLFGPAGGVAGGLVSSVDLETWQFEPLGFNDNALGMPEVSGRLFQLLGVGTTSRPIIRSEPAR